MSGLPLRRQVLQQLALATGWMSRADLQLALDCREHALDGELADLVMAGQVLYQQRTREYKLAGTPVARKALRELVQQPGLQRFVVGEAGRGGNYRLGIARRVQDERGEAFIAMAEIELQKPGAQELLRLGQLCEGGPTP